MTISVRPPPTQPSPPVRAASEAGIPSSFQVSVSLRFAGPRNGGENLDDTLE
jgi:hypothetical protein